MTSGTLKTAGWLAMASAFLTLPVVYLSFSLEGRPDAYAAQIQTFIQAAGTLIFVAIILYLKRFLNELFTFHDCDTGIALMVMASMATGAVTIGIFSFPALKESLQQVVIVILAVQGAIQILFGYRLLRLPDNLGGLLKPFCYANMAAGILMASVVLMPLSIPVSALSDLMLGTIFFNSSKLVGKRPGHEQKDA